MRVAIVQETVDRARGGAESATLELAAALARGGADVTILARLGPGAHPGDEPTNPRLRLIASRGATRSLRTRRWLRRVEELCAAEAFDVVHAITPCLAAQVYQPRGGLFPEAIARSIEYAAGGRAGRALRRLARRLNLRQQMLLRLERRLLTAAQAPMVAAVSDYVRRQVARYYPQALERTRVVFNGVAFTPHEGPTARQVREVVRRQLELSEVPVILFVAHNFRLKGLRELLSAAARLPSDWHLVIAGRGRPGPYERQAERLGIPQRLRFVGAGVAPRDLYAAADVLAHPTWYDPCSRVVLEALCAGLPVVTTRFNGAAEAIEPGRHGWVIGDPRNSTELAEALRRAADPELRRRCAQDAPALRRELSMERHARELGELYAAVCGRAP